MKLTRTSFAALLMAMSSMSLAAPAVKREEADCSEKRAHVHHNHKREVVYEYAYVTVTVDGSGSIISPASDSAPSSASIPLVSVSSSSSIAPPIQSPQAPSSLQNAPLSAAAASLSASSSAPSDSSDSSSLFVDGTVPCSQFPSGQFGVVPLPYLGYGGWSGIHNSDGSGDGPCREGSYCSYACKPGMTKTQWPSVQPESGVALGGLFCRNGYLHRSNPNVQEFCKYGKDKAVVTSELTQGVAICQTDYPGREIMSVPTYVLPGTTSPLTCIDSDNDYIWRGGKTSAHYFVNNAGVSQEEGCSWGSQEAGVGNWAPLNWGAGYSGNFAYLSLIPNPANRSPLNFNVKIIADFNSRVEGSCVYSGGVYSGSGTDGCTVTVVEGRGKFLLY